MQKTLLLAGAMALSFAAAPAFAETLSTPSELEQTRSLNSGAQTGTYVTADALNGQYNNTTESAGIPDPPFGRPAVPSAFGPNGPSNPPALEHKAPIDPDEFIALQTVDPDRINGDEVETADGMAIGRVRDVKLGANGAPKEIAIELNDGRNVRVPESALRFNPRTDFLLTNMDENQLIASSEDEAPDHTGKQP